MASSDELRRLADRVEQAVVGDNALDVLVEVALFEPCDEFSAIRSNAAGSKVICTTVGGSEMTLIADDWTFGLHRRAQTAAALRARAAQSESK